MTKPKDMSIFETEIAIRAYLAVTPEGFLTKTINGAPGVDANLYDYQMIVMLSDPYMEFNPLIAFMLLNALNIEEILWLKSISEINEKQNTILKEISDKIQNLSERFDKLDSLLKNLSDLIDKFNDLRNSFENLAKNIEQSVDNLKEILDEISQEIQFANTSLSEIKARTKEYFEKRWEGFQNELKNGLNSWWDNFKENQLVDISREYWNTFKQNLTDWWDDFSQNTLPILEDRYSRALNLRINNFRDDLLNRLQGTNNLITLTSIDTRVGTIIEYIDTVITSIAAVEANLQTNIGISNNILISTGTLLTELTTIGGVVTAIEVTVSTISKITSSINAIFLPFKPDFYSYLESKFQQDDLNIESALNSYREKYHDELTTLIAEGVEKVILNTNLLDDLSSNKMSLQELSKTISNEVTNKIVGESYSKWNSVTSFYPTIVFIMKELTKIETPRRAQIKLRYNKEVDNITDKDIADLRQKVLNMSDLKYNYGTLRVNFVSKDKISKTTIYVSEKQDLIYLLTNICKVADISWDEKDLTFTYGHRRSKITSRKIPLDDIFPNEVNYNQTFPLKLYKVVLLINGLEKPILIYQDD